MVRRFAFACLVLLLATAAGADTRAGRLARLRHDLLSQPSATQVLTRWCAALHLAEPAVVRAQTMKAPDAAPASVRVLLKAKPDEIVRHRHVRLTCGGHVLSEADNWYLPGRLTQAMNRTLTQTETPFGTAVRALNFHRQTVATSQPSGGAAVLQVKAVLLTPDEVPISLVVENYRPVLVGR